MTDKGHAGWSPDYTSEKPKPNGLWDEQPAPKVKYPIDPPPNTDGRVTPAPCPNCAALRRRVEELDARVLEMLWDRFADCPCPVDRGNEAGDWYMPGNSNEEETCAELHERGLLEKHPEKDWFRKKEAPDGE